MKYIYGPLQSRRLGVSLGINVTPFKACTLDCVYCQLGSTTLITSERKDYLNADDILEELKLWLCNNIEEAKRVDYITFSGSGEPTLNKSLGLMIGRVKEMTSIPVAVITNSSLLNDTAVRQELFSADLIVPTLNTASEKVFQELHKPCEKITVHDIIQGLIALRKEFRGKLWLEVMIVKGINDDMQGIQELSAVIEKINPDKIHLNSPVRAPEDAHIQCPDAQKLEKIRQILGPKCVSA